MLTLLGSIYTRSHLRSSSVKEQSVVRNSHDESAYSVSLPERQRFAVSELCCRKDASNLATSGFSLVVIRQPSLGNSYWEARYSSATQIDNEA